MIRLIFRISMIRLSINNVRPLPKSFLQGLPNATGIRPLPRSWESAESSAPVARKVCTALLKSSNPQKKSAAHSTHTRGTARKHTENGYDLYKTKRRPHWALVLTHGRFCASGRWNAPTVWHRFVFDWSGRRFADVFFHIQRSPRRKITPQRYF